MHLLFYFNLIALQQEKIKENIDIILTPKVSTVFCKKGEQKVSSWQELNRLRHYDSMIIIFFISG